MIFNVIQLYNKITMELIRLINGSLFTEDQIQVITTHTIGKHFADFFPETKDEKEKVEEARFHLNRANNIISSMQTELATQTTQLDTLLNEIEDKKRLAQKYEVISNINKEHYSAFKEEMEVSLRKELTAKSEEGKNTRRLVSFIIWLITLISGATLGSNYNNIINWI